MLEISLIFFPGDLQFRLMRVVMQSFNMLTKNKPEINMILKVPAISSFPTQNHPLRESGVLLSHLDADPIGVRKASICPMHALAPPVRNIRSGAVSIQSGST
jgi:hypothetical protein